MQAATPQPPNAQQGRVQEFITNWRERRLERLEHLDDFYLQIGATALTSLGIVIEGVPEVELQAAAARSRPNRLSPIARYKRWRVRRNTRKMANSPEREELFGRPEFDRDNFETRELMPGRFVLMSDEGQITTMESFGLIGRQQRSPARQREVVTIRNTERVGTPFVERPFTKSQRRVENLTFRGPAAQRRKVAISELRSKLGRNRPSNNQAAENNPAELEPPETQALREPFIDPALINWPEDYRDDIEENYLSQAINLINDRYPRFSESFNFNLPEDQLDAGKTELEAEISKRNRDLGYQHRDNIYRTAAYRLWAQDHKREDQVWKMIIDAKKNGKKNLPRYESDLINNPQAIIQEGVKAYLFRNPVIDMSAINKLSADEIEQLEQSDQAINIVKEVAGSEIIKTLMPEQLRKIILTVEIRLKDLEEGKQVPPVSNLRSKRPDPDKDWRQGYL